MVNGDASAGSVTGDVMIICEVDGNVSASATSGDVSLDRSTVSGTAALRSRGDVDVIVSEFNELDIESNGNGDILITYTNEASDYNIDFYSTGGEVYYNGKMIKPFLTKALMRDGQIYKEFEAMHPRHEAIPYVLFNIGMSNYNGYPSIDRPTTQIEEAYSYFSRLRESYPGTEYATAATEYMEKCRRYMAEHELYIADFYFRLEKYGAALLRYKNIIRLYPDVQDIHEHATEKSKAAFIKNREQQAETTREKREGSWKDWFDWL